MYYRARVMVEARRATKTPDIVSTAQKIPVAVRVKYAPKVSMVIQIMEVVRHAHARQRGKISPKDARYKEVMFDVYANMVRRRLLEFQ